MNALSYRVSDTNGLSFELLVDGEPLGNLIGARDTELPYWIVGEDLPTWPPNSPDASPGIHIVAVCSCGEYGCGHTRCRVIRSDESVVFSNFDSDCTPNAHQRRFEFPRPDYDSVVAEIVRLAYEKQDSALAGENSVDELLAWADRLETAADGPEDKRRGLDSATLKECAGRVRDLANRKASTET